ncbi:hypothetical protein SAMN06265339_1418 [Desulfurobacterium pacificum]|uniref:GTP-binding protein n=1 Tax=Desulfurobacterium pacificum TaxID=240166 RepID=A0ABY1NR12_9BACT|nr:hypothetical protein [Desulfurobacterium pacificum]SMP15760.1 hypothetical protein SAMN06265339_1418 [Desulfurobacterium pacificum]
MKKIIVCGKYNAGKTTFIKNINPEKFTGTEVNEIDLSTLLEKDTTTTVGVEVNFLSLNGYEFMFMGVPGQERFDFIWEIAGGNFDGIVFLHPSYEKPEELEKIVGFFSKLPAYKGAAKRIFITFPDAAQNPSSLLATLKNLKIPFEVIDPRDGNRVKAAAESIAREIIST